jgi:hypothetical protein
MTILLPKQEDCYNSILRPITSIAALADDKPAPASRAVNL